MSGPKSVSYTVDPAVLAAQRRRAELVARRANVEARMQAFAGALSDARARFGRELGDIRRPGALSTRKDSGEFEDELQRAEGDLRACEEDLAAATRRCRGAAFAASVLALVPVEGREDLRDRSLERMEERLAVRESVEDDHRTELTETVKRIIDRLDADVDGEVVDAIHADAERVLAVERDTAALLVDLIRSRVRSANDAAAGRRAAAVQHAAWEERLAGLPGSACQAARAVLAAWAPETPLPPAQVAALEDAEREGCRLAARDHTIDALEGVLADLGYECGPEFDTMLAEDGFADVVRPAWSGYAVRVRFQARDGSVRFNVVRGVADESQELRDREVEGAWCESMPAILAGLGRAGISAAVTHSVEAGVHPVQVIDNLPTAGRRRRERAQRTRTLEER